MLGALFWDGCSRHSHGRARPLTLWWWESSRAYPSLDSPAGAVSMEGTAAGSRFSVRVGHLRAARTEPWVVLPPLPLLPPRPGVHVGLRTGAGRWGAVGRASRREVCETLSLALPPACSHSPSVTVVSCLCLIMLNGGTSQ